MTNNTRNQNQNNNQNDQGRGDEEAEDRLLPEDEYTIEVTEVVFGSSGNDTEQVGISGKIIEGKYTGRRLTYYGYFTDAGAEWAVKAMRSCGFTGNDITNTKMMIGHKANFVVRHETDEREGENYGKVRARVRFVNTIGVVMKNKYEGAQLSKMAQNLKGAFMRYGGGAQGGGGGGGGRELPPARGGQRGQGGGGGQYQGRAQGNQGGQDQEPDWMSGDGDPGPSDEDFQNTPQRGRRG